MMQNNNIKYVPIGEFIELFEKTNSERNDYDVYGINREKTFMPTVANMTDIDTKKYKIVENGVFVFSGMQTGRDVCIRIALYENDTPGLVSPAYTTFKLKENTIHPEYFFMYFLRDEMDRFGWFTSDSSVRANLDWPRFLDIKIPVPYKNGKPDAEKQQEIVNVWKGLRKIKEENEAIAEPLFRLCQSYIQDLRKKYKPIALEPFIEKIDRRNSDNSIKEVRSVSVLKEFNTTNAKVDKNNLSNYKIVEPNQISFVQTTGNEKCLCAAINNFDFPVVVTSVNEVFKCKEDKLLAEYLHLYFRRKETDRYARYHSWGSARETFTWEDMCRFEIPIPTKKEQEAVVSIYKCAKKAKELAEIADKQSREICPALFQMIEKEV